MQRENERRKNIYSVILLCVDIVGVFSNALFPIYESGDVIKPLSSQDAQSSLSLESIQAGRLFTFPEVQLATHDFDESLVIGHGGFGKVYKGTITNGESLLTTAIKRLESSSNQGAVEFWAEVDMLSKLRHCHLVSLIGYCNEGQEMILVYEFMPNGSLADHLHKFLTGLTWVRRLKICIGAARGLDYLHTGTGINHGVMHRDVKSSNVLLDNSWAAKISDFGLSKIGPTNQSFTYVNTMVRGTFGYLDLNYFYTGKLTRKSDVYAFGVVLFEVLCGKKAVDTSIDEEQCSLAAWAHDSIKEGRLKQIVDLNLRGTISSKCLKEFAQLADRCLHSSPKKRPTMAEVVVGLESILASQEEPKQMLSPLGMKIFGKMLPACLFQSSQENSGKRRSRAVKEKKATMAAPVRTGTGVGGGGEAGTSSSKDNVTVAPAEGERNRLVLFEGGVYSFDLEDLLRASAEVLGKGSVGTSYKAVLEEGTTVVVKRLKDVVVSKKEFDGVMEGLGKMKNENVVSIRAYYHSKDENMLVCDYFRAGSLSELLHGNRGSGRTPLDWDHRLRIALSAAKGVAYLHVAGKVVHGNIKSSNILLRQDSNKDAFVSDFGLNTLFGASSPPNTRVNGYRAPEVLETREVTFKSDVYSFGVLLLELLSGKSPNQASLGEEGIDLPRWVQSVVREEWTAEVFDVELMRYQNIEEEMVQLLQIAMKCVSIEHDKRPAMQEVVRMMEDMNRAETDDGIV